MPVRTGVSLVAASVNPTAAVSPGVPEDNTVAAYAIACDDLKCPKKAETYAHNVAEDRAKNPHSAGFPANVRPCAFWRNAPVESLVRVSDHGPHNIMVLHNRRDPSTPLETGRGMRAALGKRATMVTADAGGHVVYGTQGPKACPPRLLTPSWPREPCPPRTSTVPSPDPSHRPAGARGPSSAATLSAAGLCRVGVWPGPPRAGAGAEGRWAARRDVPWGLPQGS